MPLDAILGKLNVLVVDDNAINLRTMELILEPMVAKVFTASCGLDSLEVFRNKEIDVVFTDQDMPNMTGVELTRIIIEEKPETPVVLVTGHNDTDVLIDALNSGITHFLPKPITIKSVRRALENSFQKVLVKKLEQESSLKDFELLKFKERYHSLQEKNAFEKQLNLIKNDFQGVFLESSEATYFVNTFYKPLDTLSGDGYSVRKLEDGSVFIFLIDSMGKGISASVTTFMSIAFVNHVVDRLNISGKFVLSVLIRKYLDYVRKVLLEEEMVSCAFVKINSDFDEMEYALFSVPSIAYAMADGLYKVKSNNPPLMSFTEDFSVGTQNIRGVKSIAIFSDGLLENEFLAINSQKEILYDLINDNTPFMYMKTFLEHTIKVYDDDITFIHINSSNVDDADEVYIKPDFRSVMDYINGVESNLKAEGLSDDDVACMTTVLTELVMNAFEHGCLGLDLEEKTKLISEGTYDDVLSNAIASDDHRIKVLTQTENRSGSLVFCAEVSDKGRGFDFKSKKKVQKSLFGGNGIKVVASLVDDIYFNEKGNKVRIYKTIRGECTWK